MKIAVISGASSGVGLEISHTLLNHNWKVICLSRSKPSFISDFDSNQDSFQYISADIQNPDQIKKAFDKIKLRYQKIDLLINNAAIFKMGPFLEFSLQDINQIIDTNLKGAIFCTHQALSLMMTGSRIINIGSVAGMRGIKYQSIYSSSKFGLDGFADSLNQELIALGISITTINSGGINTPLWNEKNPYPADLSSCLKSSDIASLVLYIANLPERIIFKNATIFPNNEWH